MTTPSPPPKKHLSAAKSPDKTPEETPEEHVHESLDRQKAVQKKVVSKARKLHTETVDKAAVLAIATEVLSSRVQGLAELVTINNKQIEGLRSEVNKKPDDVEVQFIAGLARAERLRLLFRMLGVVLLASVISGYVSYQVSQTLGIERCRANSSNINTIVNILDGANTDGRFDAPINDLRSNRNVC